MKRIYIYIPSLKSLTHMDRVNVEFKCEMLQDPVTGHDENELVVY